MHQTASLVHLENRPKPAQAANVEPSVEAASRSAGEEDEGLYDEEEDEYYEEEDEEDDEYDGFDNDFAVTGTTIATHHDQTASGLFFLVLYLYAADTKFEEGPCG